MTNEEAIDILQETFDRLSRFDLVHPKRWWALSMAIASLRRPEAPSPKSEQRVMEFDFEAFEKGGSDGA